MISFLLFILVWTGCGDETVVECDALTEASCQSEDKYCTVISGTELEETPDGGLCRTEEETYVGCAQNTYVDEPDPCDVGYGYICEDDVPVLEIHVSCSWEFEVETCEQHIDYREITDCN